MELIKKGLKILLKAIGGLIGLIALYIILGFIISMIPVNTDYQKLEKGIPIFIRTNGVHANFIVPSKNEIIDWQKHLSANDFYGHLTEDAWLAFGWGDRVFYLETPEWSDLNLLSAANSAILNTPSAMHVTCYRNSPKTNEHTLQVFISGNQYRILVSHIQESFLSNENGFFDLIEVAGYRKNDRFYQSPYSYNFVQTCNYWVVKGLKKMGIRTSFWSPFDKGIFWQLD